MATISKFFEGLGLPFRNVRWSWGARNDYLILLRTWGDEYKSKERQVLVLREPAGYQMRESYGLDERIRYLKDMWDGGTAAYTVMANVVDASASPRVIKDFRDDVVFSIKRLEARADGAILAVLDELVPVANLLEHSKTFRTAPAEGPFPVQDVFQTGLSTASYKEKIPAMRNWLIEVSHRKGYVTYGELMENFGITFFPLTAAMGQLGHACKSANEPIITALIVDKDSLHCSNGFEAEFGIEDDQAERERCYAHWSPQAAVPTSVSSVRTTLAPKETPFEALTRRFVEVEVRPHQTSFRISVFKACGGKCVVSGCDVPEALEAAHLSGRNWREGQNQATDGVLLRRDLHALYDRGLLVLTEDGGVQLDSKVLGHYGHLLGVAEIPA
ncbi:HNH endonuclease signature motif containing protein [Rhodoferax sp. TS-BS-61-7]|uniref:HNH endonuclease signature motif containing protein n=1 Tax=Rhodoferax sp. TS-BS-61-7 TaxID=2094194 RepID=UPI000CF64C4C|nr:HNH endonuclease signature motif containing protein [Rhodoferax sp. TS-BS-61-7]PQA78078.1 HNH endonuclease [Rhodoferax sp. TS-BS-61-7]